MAISAEFSIVLSFAGFCWIFWKKVYPFLTKTLDEHIELVKKKINEAESLKEKASAALKMAYAKKVDIDNIIEENCKISLKKINKLSEENEKYLKSLRERHEASLKARLEAELAKQKDQIIEKLSEVIMQRLSEKTHDSNCKTPLSISKKDLKRLIG
jgi:F0F1-type ATP synthase membrane subunit b/b'